MQNHLELVYCNVQPQPIVANVMVPVPLAFQPALVTVMTMLPDAMATALNTLICPVVPAANVAVSAAAVVK
jgi:hypothetical protein